MDLVTGAIDRLIPRLENLLGDEYKLQTGMKKQVRFLTRELASIRAFLCKVSDVPWYQLDEHVKVWAREAREASYDMDDILDKFHVRFEGREPANPSRLKRTMKKMTSLFSTAKARRDISCAIQDIKDRLQEVADRRGRYSINDIAVNRPTTTTSTVDPRLRAMYKEVANLVGINKPRDDLMSVLSSQTEDVAHKKRIFAIVGIGGLGKTTLAKAVYDKISVDFDCGAFVPVGQNPNLSKLLMDILYELDKKKFEHIHTRNRDKRQLIDNLREFLTNKRWIAEGFIQGKPGIWLFELGEQYFNSLVNRSMVQAIESEFTGMVEGCHVHDMVFDLIRYISSQENFITILDNDEGTVSSLLRPTRRIALHNNTTNHTTNGNMVDMRQVRSFAAVGCALRNWVQYSNCELLRVLDLEACKDVRPSDLVHLGNLLHLRYLRLKEYTKIYCLPDEIGGLKFLETLILQATQIGQLTPSISQLTQLVCLKCTDAPSWTGKLTSLEEL